MYTKRKRGQVTSSTFPRHRQTPNCLKRVNAHAERRELSTFVLDNFLYIGDIRKQESKSGYSSYMSYCYFISAHRHLNLIWFNIIRI